MRRGIDPAAEAVRRAKKLMFNPQLWKRGAVCGSETRREWVNGRGIQGLSDCAKVKTGSGEFGYLRIWSFDVDDDQRFIDAAIELLGGLPDRGLIIDLRDNPGGFIWAAERMLQFFTPDPGHTDKICIAGHTADHRNGRRAFNQRELGPWADSLASAPSTRRALFHSLAHHPA